MTDYSSRRFQKLSPKKQQAIIQAAIEEFSEHGYENANTNRIAASAGISVGALFTYFDNKRQLFLAVTELGAQTIETLVESLLRQDTTTEDKFEQLLRLILKTSRRERSLVRLYHDLSSIGNKEIIDPLATRLESYTAKAYEKLLDEGVRRGEVRSDIHLKMAAFHLDNLFLSLQYAYACDYYEARFGIYVSDNIHHETYDDFVVGETLKILRGAFLTPRL